MLSSIVFLAALIQGICCQLVNSQAAPKFVVTAPLRARYDSRLTFSVSASHVLQQETVRLTLNASGTVLNSTELVFTSDGVQTWTVEVTLSRMSELQDRQVQLEARYSSTVETLSVPMDMQSGFLMIQTDKPIYTPRQTVMYRVLALDDDQRFAKWPVTVKIQNQDNIILDQTLLSAAEAFSGRNFTLPSDAIPGTWRIIACYGGKIHTQDTVEFKVEEYVLPTFKVEVTVDKKVISPRTYWMKIKVSAKHSYQRPVQGAFEIRLGALRTHDIVYFPGSLTGRLDASGQRELNVPLADKHNASIWFPDGHRLWVKATVTEDGTGENFTGVDMGTIFADPFYKISFAHSKRFFRPGFPYTFVADVTAANGSPATNVAVFASIEVKGNGGHHLSVYSKHSTLDSKGRFTEVMEVPREAIAIKIELTPLDPRVLDYTIETFEVLQFTSQSNQYLHLRKENNGIIITFTPAEQQQEFTETITILMLSRGHLIHSTTLPRTTTGEQIFQLTPQLLRAAAPSARVVAYFFHYYFYDSDLNRWNAEIVSDSLHFESTEACWEELSLSVPASIFATVQIPKQPKEVTEFHIAGGPHMRVGLLAVDTAVYYLSDKVTLSRDKVIAKLKDHDLGNGVGDGSDTQKVFEFSGVQYVTLTDRSVDFGLHLDSSLFPHLLPGTRGNMEMNVVVPSFSPLEETVPLEQVRKYFPESWLFKELTLPRSGFAAEKIRMPDSITTWAFTAVGVGQHGGVCMSLPLSMEVFKPFFAQVRLPYKAVRLEEVVVHIGIYNYKLFPINVNVTVRGDEGLCFSEGEGGSRVFTYDAELGAKQTNSKTLRVIPLKAGTPRLLVDVKSRNGLERDTVEKSLYVVAEGRRVRKSITFPLDPSGKHSAHHAPDSQGTIQQTSSATVRSRIFTKSNKQMTSIDLYMPEEIIHGSGKCQISACGDLMGDIISHAVLDGNNLFENTMVDAEEAVGNLAPTVQALLYLKRAGLLPDVIEQKGKEHVKFRVAQLLAYRKGDGSFGLTKQSPSATWLTALVLKTLCHAEHVTYVDHNNLIDRGFEWLRTRVQANGSLLEQDRRLARASLDYDIMLAAEVAIAMVECERPQTEGQLTLVTYLQQLLDRNVEEIRSPLVMAKSAYALILWDPRGDSTLTAISRLQALARETRDGLQYWAVANDDEPPRRPFWYHSGSKASSIEATAYSLLVFAKDAEERERERERSDFSEEYEETSVPSNITLDSVAGWLIQKRNSRGAFIGALDTAVAIQALSNYGLAKQVYHEVNLQCQVTTSPHQNYSMSFDFSDENAILPKSLSNVPIGKQLQVTTRGTGLGQMQVHLEYNIPVEANADCMYDVTVARQAANIYPSSDTGNRVCDYCGMGCDDTSGSGSARSRRSIPASRVSICLQVCLRYRRRSGSDRTILDIEMLSGFEPYQEDLEQMYARRERLDLRHLGFNDATSTVSITFDQIPQNRNVCVSFRARDLFTVYRRNPAKVTVRSHDEPAPTCVQQYDPVTSDVNLAVYCSSSQASNQGECRCFSGKCASCRVQGSTPVTANTLTDIVCQTTYAYKISNTNVSDSRGWVDMVADIHERIVPDDRNTQNSLLLVSPTYCPCPRYNFDLGVPHYFFGSHVTVFVDRNNQQKFTYLLDETSHFLSDDPANNTRQLLSLALQHQCPT